MNVDLIIKRLLWIALNDPDPKQRLAAIGMILDRAGVGE